MDSKKIMDGIKALEKEFIDIRHKLHQHPEVGFKEEKTSDFIAGKLNEWGYELERGIGGTGMVATLKSGDGSSKKVLGLRAEMDALPILEESGVPWTSTIDGVGHMCGHDGHSTMLLCAAKYIAQTKNFNGTLHLIYQPAEELLYGGSTMMSDGLFDKYPCDALFAMHNMPGFKAGEIYFRKGVTMASSDTVEIEVTGVGGHGAEPNKAIDTVVATSQIVISLQSIVSRNVNPFIQAVVTVGSIHGGTAANVIPSTCKLLLTVRALDKDTRAFILKRINEMATKTAESFGATAKVNHLNGSPVLINGNEATDFAYKVGCEVLGADKCHADGSQFMGSEDFAFMLEKYPNGSYFIIGNGTTDANGAPVHSSKFDFNDNNIIPGAAMWVAITESYLK